MAYAFKPINSTDKSLLKSVAYKSQQIDSGSAGVYVKQYRSGSKTSIYQKISSSISKSYWHNLDTLHYKSSSLRTNQTSETDYFYKSVIREEIQGKTQHLNKFNDSGSIIMIPQYYFGEQIKPETFVLTDNSTTKEIIIKDDGAGNLYSSNAHDSRSSATSISSSDNYIGNIFYNYGSVIIAETGSWSGSSAADAIKYPAVTTGNFKINFKSTQTIYTNQWKITINSGEYNRTMNHSARADKSGSTAPINEWEYLANPLTSSIWSPYITGVELWQYSNEIKTMGSNSSLGVPAKIEGPVIAAKFPRPIKVPKTKDNIPLTIMLRVDMPG